MHYNKATQTLSLEGRLSFNEVPTLYQQAKQLMKYEDILVIDCAALNYADSAGLAFLIACLRMANHKNLPLQFTHLPSTLEAIAKVCNVNELLFQEHHG